MGVITNNRVNWVLLDLGVLLSPFHDSLHCCDAGEINHEE
jgi:hypothetical protein